MSYFVHEVSGPGDLSSSEDEVRLVGLANEHGELVGYVREDEVGAPSATLLKPTMQQTQQFGGLSRGRSSAPMTRRAAPRGDERQYWRGMQYPPNWGVIDPKDPTDDVNDVVLGLDTGAVALGANFSITTSSSVPTLVLAAVVDATDARNFTSSDLKMGMQTKNAGAQSFSLAMFAANGGRPLRFFFGYLPAQVPLTLTGTNARGSNPDRLIVTFLGVDLSKRPWLAKSYGVTLS